MKESFPEPRKRSSDEFSRARKFLSRLKDGEVRDVRKVDLREVSDVPKPGINFRLTKRQLLYQLQVDSTADLEHFVPIPPPFRVDENTMLVTVFFDNEQLQVQLVWWQRNEFYFRELTASEERELAELNRKIVREALN